MIVVKLRGGLGNQMFQYAIARHYKRSDKEKIILDTRLLGESETDIENIRRPYALYIFDNLQAEKFDANYYNFFTNRNLFYKVRRFLFKYNAAKIVQEVMEFVPHSPIAKKHISIEGNFQSELYFKSIRNELLNEFSFPEMDKKNELLKEEILKTPEAASIHIRRADYLSTANKSIFTSVNLEYYRNAITYLSEQINVKKLKAYIFTDDINWVKENFKIGQLNGLIISGNNNEDSWKDMALMAACKHHIVANSSFSWWGAWLSQRKGINLAPKYWLLPNTYSYDINSIVPKTWNIIDYNNF